MSASGVWCVMAARDDDLAPYAGRFATLLAEYWADPRTGRLWEGWRSRPELVPADENVSRIFQELAGTHPIADPDIRLVRDCQRTAADDAVPPVVAVTRKVDPAGILFHGLGPARAVAIPGAFGNFLLTAAECRTAWPAVQGAFSLDQGERSAVLERMETWLLSGDAPLDVEELLDGLPRIWAQALELGLGLCATTETI